MKKALLLTAVMLLGASVAFGQAGYIGLFADPAGTDCFLPDVMTGGLVPYYAVHMAATVTGSQWAAPKPACYLSTYLNDTPVFPVTVGNSQVGVSIGYGACYSSPIHCLTLNVFPVGATQPCCQWDVGPDPNAGGIFAVDCAFVTIPASGAFGMVNGNTTDCPCSNPTEETTWGKVKSLYVE